MVNETNASATMTSNERTARAMADNATAVYPDRHLYNGRRSFVTDLVPRACLGARRTHGVLTSRVRIERRPSPLVFRHKLIVNRYFRDD